MLVPASAPLLPNGSTPITDNQILRSQAYLFRMNSAADNAKAAVLGQCQVPTGLTDSGVSSSPILAWISANPGMALAIAVGLMVLMSSGKGRR